MKRIVCTCLLVVVAAAPAQEPLDAAKLAEQFETSMSGCKMVGYHTITGSDQPPRAETYTIARVTEVREGKWRFDAKIEYAGKSVTVPVIVPVVWAGDTPVIQVTDVEIPTLGTFSARVLIYRDHYAGWWTGVDHGGFMYGDIVRGDAVDAAGKQEAAKPSKSGEPIAQWASWRGVDGTGVAANANPPIEWSEEKNVRWKVALPGLGHSSPIVFGDRVYVTTAIETDQQGEAVAEEAPPEAEQPGGRRGRRGGGRRGFGGARPTKIHEFVVLALDRQDGSVVWQTTVKEAVPHEGGHADATQASNSPLTDGEHIFASFGSRGIHCLDMTGKTIWSKDYGQMRTANGFGEGASPALHGDTLVVNWDHEGDSFIVALDKRTGAERWRKPRDERTSWSTPLVVPVDGRPQVIVNATGASRAYDLETGDVVWSLGGMTPNCIPSPACADGVVYLMSGFRGNALQAIRLAGAKGDLADSDNVLWRHNEGTSYVPSQLVYDGFLYFLRTNSGVLSCLDAKTGKVHYEGEKLGFKMIYASPVGAAGRVYLTSRDGVTKVIKLGATYEELATNTLDDGFDASAAIVGDTLLLRGRKSLYCIGE